LAVVFGIDIRRAALAVKTSEKTTALHRPFFISSHLNDSVDLSGKQNAHPAAQYQAGKRRAPLIQIVA